MSQRITKIFTDKSFDKIFTKYKNKLTIKDKEKLRERITLFIQNPFNPILETHKLKGKYKRYWAFSVSHSDRIMFRFIDESKVLFIDIDDHDIYK